MIYILHLSMDALMPILQSVISLPLGGFGDITPFTSCKVAVSSEGV